MGKYNPHAPYIIGNEWVPIVDEAYEPDVETEVGYTFTLDQAVTVVSGGFYIDDMQTLVSSSRAVILNLYERGQEVLTGPVKKLTIPCVAVNTVAGTPAYNGTPDSTLTYAQDLNYISFANATGSTSEVTLHFSVNSYSAQLSGKRILNVSLELLARGDTPGSTNETNITRNINIAINRASTATGIWTLATDPNIIPGETTRQTITLGNINEVTDATSAFDNWRRYTWTYGDLARFVEGATNALSIGVRAAGYISSSTVPEELSAFDLFYAALTVTYCEENRLAQGGTHQIYFDTSASSGMWRVGQNNVQLRPAQSVAATGVTLPAGEYTVTATLADQAFSAGEVPKLRALRQLYALPTHTGVQLVRTLKEGKVPTLSTSDVLPPIALNLSSRIVTGAHVYGQLFGRPVHDTASVAQDIDDDTTSNLTTLFEDDFNRVVVDGWGTTTPSGHTWVTSGVNPLEANVTPGAGTVVIDDRGFSRRLYLNESTSDQGDYTVLLTTPNVMATGTHGFPYSLMQRYVDNSNHVRATMDLNPDGTAELFVSSLSTTTGITTTSAAALGTYTPSQQWYIRFVVHDLQYGAKAWRASDPEPSTWQVSGTFTDIFIPSSGQAGVRFIVDVGNLNLLPITFTINEFTGGVSGQSYPQVRFYARRFGNTDVPLTLENTDGDSVSITSDEFDLLPEIIDGWKEVTLRFTDPAPQMFPTVDTAPDWIWHATGLDVGSQWQIMTIDSDDNYTSNPYSPHPATYGAPQGGDVSIFGDDSADAVLIFSQDPPMVTGLAVEVATQNLTPIGQECAVNPECIPTALYYNNITWLPVTSLPATGFGYYELQRQDDDQDDPDAWDTILQASSYTVTGFADYETRVGVPTRYRIRVANVLDFYGSWSQEQETTLTSPGVVGAGSDGNSVLIFTTNSRQDGSSNLAYVQVWDSRVSEEFTFPEADSVQMHALYGRDYVTAFKPTERGGERFSRTMLVQNAAVSDGRMRSGFRSLRDMAWDDVPYICVRNELGDRWFATVQVPNGRIQRNRRLYVAQVNITEVTDTPCTIELPEE